MCRTVINSYGKRRRHLDHRQTEGPDRPGSDISHEAKQTCHCLDNERLPQWTQPALPLSKHASAQTPTSTLSPNIPARQRPIGVVITLAIPSKHCRKPTCPTRTSKPPILREFGAYLVAQTAEWGKWEAASRFGSRNGCRCRARRLAGTSDDAIEAVGKAAPHPGQSQAYLDG